MSCCASSCPFIAFACKYLLPVGFWLLWAANCFLTLWCTGALWYLRCITSNTGRYAAVILYLAVTVVLMVLSIRYRWCLLISVALSLVFTSAWVFLQKPTGKQNWGAPFKIMPKAVFSPDESSVTIENLRDFHYRTETDFDIRYRTETYRFDDLQTVDYSVTYWDDMTLCGHIIVSFGFKDGRRLALSPEARLEAGRFYEILPGLYRRFELMFVLATEEDVFQLRTHHRKYEKEAVYLYPTNTPHDVAVFMLKDLLKRANGLAVTPEYYNGITYNCLSSMAPSAEKLNINFCSTWRGTFNGLSDKRGFDSGWLKRNDPNESFEAYKKRHYINQYVEHLTDPKDYSKLIRPDNF